MPAGCPSERHDAEVQVLAQLWRYIWGCLETINPKTYKL
jgi:hypothetical protein